MANDPDGILAASRLHLAWTGIRGLFCVVLLAGCGGGDSGGSGGGGSSTHRERRAGRNGSGRNGGNARRQRQRSALGCARLLSMDVERKASEQYGVADQPQFRTAQLH